MSSDLFDTLERRLRPEDVAQIIIEQIGSELAPTERELLDSAARYSLKRDVDRLTSMSEEFYEARPPEGRVAKARELFASARALTAAECADVERLGAFVAELSLEIRKSVGSSSFKYDRLDRQGRQAAGLDISKRRYNKLFRFLARFEEKIERYRRELQRARMRRVAKHGMAGRIARDEFDRSGAAAPFVAYFVARLNKRSEFTNIGQEGAFDDIAGMLLNRFKRAPNADGWRIVSQVMPDLDIVSHLSDNEKMRLFGDWLSLLKDIAEALRACWLEDRFDRATMIVQRGNDSSTWNAAAGAWNMARRGWLSAIYALGMEDVLDLVCLGKAMRLMAADVARWHAASGGALHPDTAVWAALPAPWEVFAGEAVCGRAEVEAACRKAGVDPTVSGWIEPRQNRKAVPFRPTPELVHGVAVSHPELALLLRKAGWFSGGTTKPLPDNIVVPVMRDPSGAALKAGPVFNVSGMLPSDQTAKSALGPEDAVDGEAAQDQE